LLKERNVGIKNFLKVYLKHFWLDTLFIYSGRWLKTFIPEKYAPSLNFDKLAAGRCRLLLSLALYL
jgi:hypothetical protein